MKSIRTQAQWIDLFKGLNSFWRHDGNPKRPHALLTGGGHSNGFFNWSSVAQYPIYAREATEDLARILVSRPEKEILWWQLNRVIGPGYGAITMADRLSEALSFITGCQYSSGFTEKGPDETMLLSRFKLNAGDMILPCEDTITSGKSVGKTIDAIAESGGQIAGLIAAICNRSGHTAVYGRPIVALVNVPMDNWTADECPLCKEGSEAIRPKKDNNWKLLNTEY
jgi:orotate phosphoribosyltransferase